MVEECSFTVSSFFPYISLEEKTRIKKNNSLMLVLKGDSNYALDLYEMGEEPSGHFLYVITISR